MPDVTRRSVLKVALATAAASAVGATVPSPAAAATTYGPRSISHVGDFGSPPSNLNYRMWNFPSGTTLSAALAKMGPNDCLVLPERSEPYLLDSSKGFAYPGSWRGMARATAGIHGMGPNTVIQPSVSAFRMGQTSTSNENVLIESTLAGAYFGNFTLKGRDFGGCAVNGIKSTGDRTTWENLYLWGAQRGWRNSPPGEAGGIVGFKGTGQTLRNTEINCTDPATGQRVGTSPAMFNQQSNVTVQDVYAHHALAGAITFWRVANPVVRRTRAEHNGSGSGGLNGHAFNLEQCSGNALLDSCTFVCDYGTNTGVHMSVGSYYAGPAKVRVVNPSNDAGPYKGVFSVNISPTYGGTAQTYRPSDITVVNSSNQPVSWKSNWRG
jgi:hypothetical protein